VGGGGWGLGGGGVGGVVGVGGGGGGGGGDYFPEGADFLARAWHACPSCRRSA